MNVLEKILEEIEERIKIIKNIPVNEDDDFLDGEECYEDRRTQGKFEELLWCRDIICSHKDEMNNDGWIPVEERLPEEGEKCIITDKYGYMRDGIIYDYADSKDDKPSFHRWDDEYWQCFRPDVIAWHPLPEPYRQKEVRI